MKSPLEPLWKTRIQDPRRNQALAVRSAIENETRAFFVGRAFLETRTPLLVPCPGMEPHIRPFRVTGVGEHASSAYLPTSPEFAMKRLLVGGLARIFQICPAFRDEPRSPHHLPEFTMLEWYRAKATSYAEIQQDVEGLFVALAKRTVGSSEIQYQGKKIDLTPPWPRFRVRDLFEEFAGVNLAHASSREALAAACGRLQVQVSATDTWDDLYFKIWLTHIEPRLPADRAVFVERYPASQAALAVLERDPDGSSWAKRFEVYAGGLEIGNAFQELADPIEQRRRFEKDMELREKLYGPSFPKTRLDEGFLSALEEGMPPSSGIAVGVDRLVMLFADEPDIDYTVWIPPTVL